MSAHLAAAVVSDVDALERALGLPSGDKSDVSKWAAVRGYRAPAADAEAALARFLETERRLLHLEAAKRVRTARPLEALRLLRLAALREELGGPVVEAQTDPASAPATVEALVADIESRLGADPARLAAMRAQTAGVGALAPAQRAQLETVRTALVDDFALRRAMLLKRCDVSVQSFLWGEAAQGRENLIVSAIGATRDGLSDAPPALAVDDALAMSRSRAQDLAHFLTENRKGRDHLATAKGVLIGAVPHRGGHVDGGARMPGWKPREANSTYGRGKGGKGKGGNKRQKRGKGD
ncbi:hypothetical protein M885DRAFT_36943 [Pelagophyceae sp. CCMP2097]|nr:hypothetical protein M885DRAFT_36943 [Pelagophyceae sp. CCMP2097]